MIAIALICIGLGSLCEVKAADKGLSGIDWDIWFERLFADRTHEWDGPRILLALMRLEKGSFQQIDPARKQIVDFWYEATMDLPEHCSMVYLAKMDTERDRCLASNYKRTVVYDFARRQLLSSCYTRLMSSIRAVDRLDNGEKEKFFRLGELWRDMLNHQDNVEYKWNLGNHIGFLVGEEARREQADFVNAWRGGICHKATSGLDEDDMSLEKFLATFDYKTREQASRSINRWITAIEACKYLHEHLDDIWRYVQSN